MPPVAPADLDALQAQLTQRLLESGEWDRIKFVLASKLNDSGWTDDMRNRSKERARTMEPLSFTALLEEMIPPATTSLPLAVRREMLALIRGYIDKQFE
ncbi:transcription factor e(y)2-domain-containing protein [Mycena olivaceomarginata]|uniref:Transcription and mRNA export factor SUS1 n=1 Tax=Mycena albidolilacea TaxID=1033008 RepID=A0AAD7EM50_9AGAR|nr:transcription factor e(y)2-domain-containing protein [Mycena albidolilacea]KAJ7902684.1 transcription factor e(y)2-domain-containing protein [Mycena olivaceomarginata]